MEYFPIVNEQGEVVGRETRVVCHCGTMLLHLVVHLHVFNSKGELYLQKRGQHKDIQPGKWDTSVGGHVDYGETIEQALHREVSEEIGISDFIPKFLFRYVFTSSVEKELVNTFMTVYNGDIFPDKSELDGGQFWTLDEIRENIGTGIFTPNFEEEFKRLIAYQALS